MHVTHLSLTNFRNYARLELSLPVGPTLLHGDNAQGKTNLLEALYYLATSRSPHADQYQQLVHWEALRPEEPIVVGRLVAQLNTGQGPSLIEMRLITERQRGQSSFRREALIDKRKVRLMDLLGHLRVVLFLPEDVQVITGPPAKRRRYLDVTLCQCDPVYCRNLSAYNKVLEQRNALLRQIAEQGGSMEMLAIYNDKLIHLSSQIFARRAVFVEWLARYAQRIHYERLTDGQETLQLNYLPRLQENGSNRNDHKLFASVVDQGRWLTKVSPKEIAVQFESNLAKVQTAELGSGSTRIGPHRDDWRFQVNGRDLSSFGSRGQQRSAILALKLAEIAWMADQTGEKPVLLLDEVVAELDERRRALLLETVQEAGQAILTATDPGMFTTSFLSEATTMTVTAGRIERDQFEPGGSPADYE